MANENVLVNSPEMDEVLRRVGRNLLLFQQIEQLLKRLAKASRMEGLASTLQPNLERRCAQLHTQTMGQVAGLLVGDMFPAEVETESEPREALSEPWFSFKFTISTDSAFVERFSSELSAVVRARNELAHHFLARWQPESEESTKDALKYLNEQREQALRLRDELQAMATSFAETVKAHVEFLRSGEFTRHLELQSLRHSRLVLLLGEISIKTTRPDGWMDLGTAGHIIRRVEPNELEGLAERYGHKTLKKLLLATELFDVFDEATPGGGTRAIYRINPRFELQIEAAGGSPIEPTLQSC